MEERTIWKGHSSHVVNFGTFVLCGLLFWLIVPIFIAFWKWLENRKRIYEVTTERIRIQRGVFTRRMEELELYRVLDSTVVEPFWYRQFGAGDIVLSTTDTSSPSLRMEAIKGAYQLREEIRKHVEECRQRKGVRIME